MIALLSIKPEYADLIFSGEKRFEYRKKVFSKEEIKRIVVYASSPLKKLIGEFEIGKIIRDTPESIWRKTADHAGIERKNFFKYFEGKNEGYAISIKRIIRYKTPINPKTVFPGFVPPQSFRYIRQNESAVLGIGALYLQTFLSDLSERNE